MSLRHTVAAVLLATGCTLEVLAVIGLAAMRDSLDRLHYVGLAAYGALLVAIAVVVRQSFSLLGDKALATGGLLVLFGPVIAHTTARTLRIRAHGDWQADAERHREEDS